MLYWMFNIYYFLDSNFYIPFNLIITKGSVLGGWWFGASPSSPDRNFLRVSSAFPNRRLSDNTLMTPKIRIAPSCASSPGGTPGGGLPIRRHSSIGPQERRGSNINLSPPTVSVCLLHFAHEFSWTDTISLEGVWFYMYDGDPLWACVSRIDHHFSQYVDIHISCRV